MRCLPGPAARTIQDALDQAATEGLSRRAVYELDLPTSRRWYEVSVAARQENGAADARFIIISRDITERRQHEREVELFAVMSTALRKAQTPKEMAVGIIDQVMSLLEVNSGVLVTHDPVAGEIVVELARGEFGISLRPRLPEAEGVSGTVISTGKVWQTGDIRQEPLTGRSDVTENVKAVVVAPLIAYGVTIGALWVGRKNPFGPTDVRLLTAIADIAANAIHRSSLFEKTRLSLQRLAALHEIDTAINSTLDLQITLKVLLEQVINQLGVKPSPPSCCSTPSSMPSPTGPGGASARGISSGPPSGWGKGMPGKRPWSADHPGLQHPQPGEHIPALRAAGGRRVCRYRPRRWSPRAR